MNDLVQIEHAGPVSTLTLNRPERHNSLIPAMLEQMLAGLAAVQARAECRAVVLQAAGRSFSTGGDLGGFYEHLDDLEAYAGRIVGLLNQVMLAMIDLPAPIVAAVHGLVTGGSLGLVLASDLVVVAPEATFTPYYTVVGFSPDGGWTAVLPDLIGSKRAAEILLLNRTITAEQALAWGLANRLVLGERIRQEAHNMAGEIAAGQPGSIAYSKRLLVGSRAEIARRLEEERASFVDQVVTPEARRGIATFLPRKDRGAAG